MCLYLAAAGDTQALFTLCFIPKFKEWFSDWPAWWFYTCSDCSVDSVWTQSNRDSEFLSLIFNALEADLILLLSVFFLTIPACTVNCQNGDILCHWPQMFHATSFRSCCAMEVLSCGFRKMHSGPCCPGSNPSPTTYWMWELGQVLNFSVLIFAQL